MSKRAGSKVKVDEALAGASERVLKQVTDLYEAGLSTGAIGAVGLKAIADDPRVGLKIRKPRKKISVMIIGNHSAGKSSFINWYIGEGIQKTGVAIETRGFTFVTSGKKRDTLTGDATVHYYDYLREFADFKGMTANLFTEISTSKDKNFSCVDLIDTPGLVDGDMQYPFDVQEAILWLAQHVDLILVFFDPIGQATCKRTMQVVERLNNGPHLEKIQYFMSKADAVDKEHDRQRVLIQITQNLATRIRNSHAFNLPTFFLPNDSNMDSGIPNAIEEVCMAVDKSINSTVQKVLKTLTADCIAIQERIDQNIELDKEHKAANFKKALQGVALNSLAALLLLALAAVAAVRFSRQLCGLTDDDFCERENMRLVHKLQPGFAENFGLLTGLLASMALALWVAAKIMWRPVAVLSKKDVKRLQEYKAVVGAIRGSEKGLYEEYFKSISDAESR